MIGIVVVAAGSGLRLGASLPKAFVDLGGVPVLGRALRPMHELVEAVEVVVVAPAELLARAAAIAEHEGVAAVVVPGGDTRQASVAAGLAALGPEVDVVLVHDAARSLAPAALFARVAAAVRTEGAGVVPALAVSDTVKRVDPDGAIESTVDRSALRAVQTPQGFPRAALDAAYADAADEHTDDAALFAASGGRVIAVDGDPDAFKITTPWDLARALAAVDPLAGGGLRVGTGTDVHAFGGDGPLRLGSLDWPGEPGLAGHSDGDTVLHALADALLSAGALGDLGAVFGVDDERYRGADSAVFVTDAIRMLADAGLRPVHASVQIVAQRPRIGPRRAELEARLRELLGVPVSVSATTSDGLGITGGGGGIAAIASALVRRA